MKIIEILFKGIVYIFKSIFKLFIYIIKGIISLFKDSEDKKQQDSTRINVENLEEKNLEDVMDLEPSEDTQLLEEEQILPTTQMTNSEKDTAAQEEPRMQKVSNGERNEKITGSIKINGRMTVAELQQQFKDAFGVTLRVRMGKAGNACRFNKITYYNHGKETLSDFVFEGESVGKKEFPYNENTIVGNMEYSIRRKCCLNVFVASLDDKHLVSDEITLVEAGTTKAHIKRKVEFNGLVIRINSNNQFELYEEGKSFECEKSIATKINLEYKKGWVDPYKDFSRDILADAILKHLNNKDDMVVGYNDGEYMLWKRARYAWQGEKPYFTYAYKFIDKPEAILKEFILKHGILKNNDLSELNTNDMFKYVYDAICKKSS